MQWWIFLPTLQQVYQGLLHANLGRDIGLNDDSIIQDSHFKIWLSGHYQIEFVAPWCSGYHYCPTSFNETWTQVLRRFKSCSRCVGDSWWWGSLTRVPAGNKAKHLSSVNHTTKAIHHHHHQQIFLFLIQITFQKFPLRP